MAGGVSPFVVEGFQGVCERVVPKVMKKTSRQGSQQLRLGDHGCKTFIPQQTLQELSGGPIDSKAVFESAMSCAGVDPMGGSQLTYFPKTLKGWVVDNLLDSSGQWQGSLP